MPKIYFNISVTKTNAHGDYRFHREAETKLNRILNIEVTPYGVLNLLRHKWYKIPNTLNFN